MSEVPPRRNASLLVAMGILLSRLAGLIRERVFAHYFGQTLAADAFKAAFRIPNFLQNLFGEGVLSASFIPVYSRLLAQGNEKEAGKVAGAIAALILLAVSIIVLLGVWLAPALVLIIAPGFQGEKQALTILLTRIFFPGAGLLVLSAWCLGILNSHRRFFLSYTAPVLWSTVMIAAMIWQGGRSSERDLAVSLAWASVLGSGVQFLVQLPVVLRLARHLSWSSQWNSPVRAVLRNFVPVFFGRGIVQISAFVDSMLASLLPTGAVAGIGYAQVLYTLPVSLFGMSVSAAELPEMSSALGNQEEIAEKLRARLQLGQRQIAVMIIPSVLALLTLGDVLAAAIYQTGKFTAQDARYVWLILAGSSVGMLASTLGRLYASAWYAMGNTQRPFLFSCVRVVISIGFGFIGALAVPRWLDIGASWGVLGIVLAASLGAWAEFFLLRGGLRARIGDASLPRDFYAKLWSAALVAAGAGSLWRLTQVMDFHPILTAGLVFSTFGLVYFAITLALGVDEAKIILRRLVKR